MGLVGLYMNLQLTYLYEKGAVREKYFRRQRLFTVFTCFVSMEPTTSEPGTYCFCYEDEACYLRSVVSVYAV